MVNNYDRAAWFYDSLSRVVFGRAIINAQIYLLQFIPSKSKIIIAGGGTGWILDELTRLHPSGLKIVYVELSKKMLALSAKRSIGHNEVKFINAPVEDITFDEQFDVVITPFLFDNFSSETAGRVFSHLSTVLKHGGLWLCADFELSGKWWQPPLLRLMQVFFRILCSIEASALPDIDRLFTQNGYKELKSRSFFNGFIYSAVFQNSNNS